MTSHRAGARSAGGTTRILVLALAITVAGLWWLRGADGEAARVGTAEAESVSPSSPARLVVPSIHLRASVDPIEVDPEGVLYPPADVARVGWWKRSAKPGSDRGQTVLTGHTVSSGGGVMNRLGDLEPGDRVRVKTPKGTVGYETTRVAVYSRAELADSAHSLFGQGRDDARLVLITCTDWDGEEYQSNIVVFARPRGSQPA